MQKEIVTLNEMKLVGIINATSYNNELKMESSVIGQVVGKYFGENIAALIPNRKNPYVTIAAYTHYETNEYGKYDYFIGEEVTNINSLPSPLTSLIAPAGRYVKLTTSPGKMPDLIAQTWQAIWKMTADELGGKRSYKVDFEIYDQRATDPDNTIIDIYLGIE